MNDTQIERPNGRDDQTPSSNRSRTAAIRRGLIALGAAFTAIAAFAIVALAVLWTLPPPGDGRPASEAAYDIAANNGAIVATRGVSRGDYIDLEAFPEHLLDAVLAMEDRRFYAHGGIDTRGITRALWVNVQEGGVEQGGSTITQQLAKISYLSADRTFARKSQEAVITLWLEARLSKDEILERYLNNVYLGGGAYGVQAASKRYFGKNAADLTLSESAMLAGLIQSPSRNSPLHSYDAAVQRADVALGAMVDAGAISAEEAEAARGEPAHLARPPAEAPVYGYAADYAASEARVLIGGTGGDFRVETTLDPRLQILADQAIDEALENAGEGGPDQAALVAMSYDGAILAMTGGRDYTASAFNRAAQAERQPGSTFKLFVYLTALQQGFTPESAIDDAPINIEGYEPQNYGGDFHGRVTIRQAFANSYNAAAVRVQEAVGRENVIRVARRLGLQGPLEPEPSLALGAREATLLELTSAYAAVAADRERVSPHMITVIAANQEQRFSGAASLAAAPGGAVFSPPVGDADQAAWPRNQALTLLGSVVASGTGRAAQIPGARVYGKTGTTSDYHDAWFIGFADGMVVGVWMGNDDNSPMEAKVTGGGLPARTWKAFMTRARSGAVPVVRERGSSQPLAGAAEVLDTGTLRVEGQIVRLEGVDGLGDPYAANMGAYIDNRGNGEVVCRPARLEAWRCEAGGVDLSEAVIFNGGGKAADDAPGLLKDAERKARRAGRGVWGE